ncbi:hypothetical protein ACIF8T_26060 [Streptomyces sp. NPDC085946]|uniref:hypothetical protein n=1 Tax=Streptomyces sp. NPDC085946 TaxID=3365744 RepID=UPI0037D84BE2
MASEALAPHVCHGTPLPQAALAADGRPVLLLVGDEAGSHGSWARCGIERHYRLLSVPTGDGGQAAVPSGVRGVVAFHGTAADRALSLAESAGLPTAALRTAARRRAVGTRRPAPSGEPAPDAALTAVVVSVVADGLARPLFVARPEREAADSGYVVEAADPLLRRGSVTEAVRAVHQELGIHGGLTATEIHVTGRGGDRRITCRHVDGLFGADPLLRAGSLATGIDCALVWADLAAGARPDLVPRRRSAAAVRFIRVGPELALGTEDLDIDELPGGIWEVHLETAGNTADESGSATRTVFAVAVGEDAAACRRALDLLAGTLRVRHRPRPAHTDERTQRRTHA